MLFLLYRLVRGHVDLLRMVVVECQLAERGECIAGRSMIVSWVGVEVGKGLESIGRAVVSSHCGMDVIGIMTRTSAC